MQILVSLRPPSVAAPWAGQIAFHALTLLCALTVTTGCRSGRENSVAGGTAKRELETIEADVLAIDLQRWPTIVRSQGSLSADEESIVGSKVAGRVSMVHFDLGDEVKTGDPLVTLDQEEFQLRVKQAEAQLEQARSVVGLRRGESVANLNPEKAAPVRRERALWDESKSSLRRAERLLEQNAISQGEFDMAAAEERVAEARYASALNTVWEGMSLVGVRQAELSLANEDLREATIRAPIDGFIRQRRVSAGSFLNVGQPIADVVRTHPLRFRGTVPERHAQSLKIGLGVSLNIESLSGRRSTRITRISPTLDPQSRALTFEAEIDNSDRRLRSGLFAEAEIVLDDDATAIAIPKSAVIEFAGVQKVWKVVDGVSTVQEVLVGERRENGYKIIDGLAVGDQILLNAALGKIAKITPRVLPIADSKEVTTSLRIEDIPNETAAAEVGQ